MRTAPDRRSPWGQRVWFEEHEFDERMDEARERAGVDVFTVGEGVDVEQVLLRVFKMEPEYAADLDEGVLGRTVFLPDGRFEIQISRDLSERVRWNAGARRLLRSTIAHECAHVVQHGPLYATDTLELFPSAPRRSVRVLCRTIESRGPVPRAVHGHEWWEYQANRGMASLLLPKGLTTSHLGNVLDHFACKNMLAALRAGLGGRVVAELARVFDVSFEMMLYRLQGLGIIPRDALQGLLPLGDKIAG